MKIGIQEDIILRKGCQHFKIYASVGIPLVGRREQRLLSECIPCLGPLLVSSSGVSINKEQKNKKPYTFPCLVNRRICILPPLGQRAILHIRRDKEHFLLLFINAKGWQYELVLERCPHQCLSTERLLVQTSTIKLGKGGRDLQHCHRFCIILSAQRSPRVICPCKRPRMHHHQCNRACPVL